MMHEEYKQKDLRCNRWFYKTHEREEYVYLRTQQVIYENFAEYDNKHKKIPFIYYCV